MLFTFTGADDTTNVNELFAATLRIHEMGHDVEWALLLYPEKQGFPRNPGFAKRMEIARSLPTAVHLCGKLVFEALLGRESAAWFLTPLLRELNRYTRIQVNINARQRDFTTEQVIKVYERLLTHTSKEIILQWHEDSASDIEEFVTTIQSRGPLFSMCPPDYRHRLHFLVDSSRGRGKTPDKWLVPSDKTQEVFRNPKNRKALHMSIAGGFHPGNIRSQVDRFVEQHGYLPDGVDMESSLRFYPEDSSVDQFAVGTCISAVGNYIAIPPTSKKSES